MLGYLWKQFWRIKQSGSYGHANPAIMISTVNSPSYVMHAGGGTTLDVLDSVGLKQEAAWFCRACNSVIFTLHAWLWNNLFIHMHCTLQICISKAEGNNLLYYSYILIQSILHAWKSTVINATVFGICSVTVDSVSSLCKCNVLINPYTCCRYCRKLIFKYRYRYYSREIFGIGTGTLATAK